NKILAVSLFAIPIGVMAQTTVSGVIKEDGTGFTLPDVKITNQTTLEEVYSDSDGNFSITANPGDVLVISGEGYMEMTITYNNQSALNVSLATSTTYQLNEVVVIGYGTTTYKDATGSVVAITEKDFNDGQLTSPEQLLVGKVAGLQITTGGGQPGSGNMIRIRGGSSLNASNDPLYVIDGIPMDNGATIAGTSNPMNFINPGD